VLDPQSAALVTLVRQRGLAAIHEETPAAARRSYLERRFYTQPAPPVIGEVRECAIEGPAGAIPARLYRPASAEELGLVVYFHGGGWTIGNLDSHDVLCRQLAQSGGFAVLSVDYRLAPEHRFPAAVDDAIAATRWARSAATTLGCDPVRIAVAGDSAGGNLAAVVALALRDVGERWLRFQTLIYPATDMRMGAPSHQTNGQGTLLTTETMAYFRGHYVPDAAGWLDWRASPLLHPDHSGLPPALVLTAGFDPLRDEGRQYADALSRAGNAAQYICFERQMHGFITMSRVLDEATSAVALCAAATARALAPAPAGA
jgi:acetyl esterase